MSKESKNNLEEILNDNNIEHSSNNNEDENIDISISNNSNKCKYTKIYFLINLNN